VDVCLWCSKRERVEVAVSDAALVGVVSGLAALGRAWGWEWLVKTYVLPYLVVNFWLVMITLLQHTHPGKCCASATGRHGEGGGWDCMCSCESYCCMRR
jgi:hypothetical protein